MKEILDAIKWYHLFFPFAFVFIFLFKNQLSDLISRITSIDEKGLKADPPPESQQEKTKTTDEVVQQLLDSVGNSKVIQDQVKTIQEALEGEGLSTEGDSEKVLIKHLAGIQLLLAFEQIQSSIFGSQIILLKKLNEVAGQGIREDLLNEYIEQNIKSKPYELEGWTAEQYLLFLRSRFLIVNVEEIIHITERGVEYLIWMVRNGRSEDRPH